MVNWPQRMCNRCHYPMMKAADERGEAAKEGTWTAKDHCPEHPTKIFLDKFGKIETPMCDPHYDIVMDWAKRTGYYQ